MLIVDSHAHLKHGDDAATEYPPDAIVAAMDAAGIAKSVVFAMSTTTRRSVEMAADAAARFPERLIPYVYAVPGFERRVLDEIDEAISDRGFRGIKMHAGECRIAPHVADPVFELAAARRVPCLIDFRGRHADLERVALAFPNTTFIAAHIGLYLADDEAVLERFICIAERRPNVLIDASGVALVRKIEDAVRRVGPGRVLFGTDGPHPKPDLASFARAEVAKILALNLSSREKEDILGGNIMRLLRLE